MGGYALADMPELTDGGGVEEHQAEGDYQIDANHFPYILLLGPAVGIDLDLSFLEETTTHHERDIPQTVVDTEEEERPVRTVPKSYKCHVQHDGEDSAVDAPISEFDVQRQEHIIR